MANKVSTKQAAELEAQHAEIVKQLQTTFGPLPLPDNYSLAQPLLMRVLPTIVTYGTTDEPILG